MTVNPEELLYHSGFISALAKKLIIDEHLADDISQQTMLAAIEKPPAGDRPLGPWLMKVARNLSIKLKLSEARRWKRERAVAEPEQAMSTEEVIHREETRRYVVEAVLNLDEPYRSTMLLRYYEGRSARLVAKIQGAPIETVRTRIKRGVQLLRRDLDNRFNRSGEDWRLALAPMIGLGFTTAFTKASSGLSASLLWKAIMSWKIKTAMSVLIVVAASFSIWMVNDDNSDFGKLLIPDTDIDEIRTDNAADTIIDPVERPIAQTGVERAPHSKNPPVKTEPIKKERKEKMRPTIAHSHRSTEVLTKLSMTKKKPTNMVRIRAGKLAVGMDQETITVLSRDDAEMFNMLSSAYPQHSISIDEFYCDINEITRPMWKAYLEATGQEPSDKLLESGWDEEISQNSKRLNRLGCVSLDEAEQYARWCGKRIPSEHEWARAAIGKHGKSNLWRNSFIRKFDSKRPKTVVVSGSHKFVGPHKKVKSSCGIYYTAGNFWEWTTSPYNAYEGYESFKAMIGDDRLQSEPKFDPKKYVIKGGNWMKGKQIWLIEFRKSFSPIDRDSTLCFRCVKDVRPGLTMLNYTMDDFDLSRVVKNGFDSNNLFFLEKYSETDVKSSRLIKDYSYCLVCPRAQTYTVTKKIRAESLNNPFPFALISCNHDLDHPALPAGTYILAYSSTQHQKEEMDAVAKELSVKREWPDEWAPQSDLSGSASKSRCSLKSRGRVLFLNTAGFKVAHVEGLEFVDEILKPISAYKSEKRNSIRFAVDIELINKLHPRFIFELKIKDDPF